MSHTMRAMDGERFSLLPEKKFPPLVTTGEITVPHMHLLSERRLMPSGRHLMLSERRLMPSGRRHDLTQLA